MKPIFIFSLPRSGSTLLQRIVAAHPQVATASEPWALLPPIYALRRNVLAEYSHESSSRAIRDLIEVLPGKRKDYSQAVRAYAETLYTKLASSGEKCFLDKTPRYFLIIEEIAEIFPDAKFIFLYRNYLDVFASTLDAWHDGKLSKFCFSEIDLREGPPSLAEGRKMLSDKSILVRFEDLIYDPKGEPERIFEYLELDFDENHIQKFSEVNLSGALGDKTDRTSIKKTKSKREAVINSGFRKNLIKKLLNGFPDEYFIDSGFSRSDLIEQLQNIRIVFNPLKEIAAGINFVLSNLIKSHNLIAYHKNFKSLRDKMLY